MDESQQLHYQQCMEYYRDIEELPDNVRFKLLKHKIMEKIAKQTGDKGNDKNLRTMNWLLEGIRDTNAHDQATLFGELRRRMSADEYRLKAMAVLAMPQFTYLLSKAFMLHNVETGNASLAQLLSALSDKPIEACMTVDDTVQRVEAWLQMAAQANSVTVKELFNAIIGVFEKKHPKKNCMWLQGLPNSGKTTMMLYFASLYQKIGRPDGKSEFFWQNLYGKRIYLCDEFGMANTPEFIAKCKELFAGVPATGITCSITVKRKGPQVIPRTPVVLLTNHDIRVRLNSVDADALKSRIVHVKNLQPLPVKERIVENLHPYAIKVMADKYLYDIKDNNAFLQAIDKLRTQVLQRNIDIVQTSFL